MDAKERAKQYFQKRIEKALSQDKEEDAEDFQLMLNKCDNIPLEVFEDWEIKDSTPLYHAVNNYVPKKTRKKSSKPTKKAYYALIYSGDRFTEKATGFITGSNNMHGAKHMVYVEFVANSLIIEQDDKKYIPAWIVSDKGLWDFVNKEDKITA